MPLLRSLRSSVQASKLYIIKNGLVDDAFQQREDYATLACSIQNMSLYLWEQGIGAKWRTGAVTRHPEVYDLLKLDPSKEEIIGFVNIGRPSKTPEAKPRPELSEVLSKI